MRFRFINFSECHTYKLNIQYYNYFYNLVERL